MRDAVSTLWDKLWLWTHEAGCADGRSGLPGKSTITPAEGARWLGVPNLLMVVFADSPRPPFAPHAEPMRSLSRIVWSVVGDSSSTRNDEASDLEAVVDLATEFPNVVGGIMDDFFHPPDGEGRTARWSADDVKRFRDRLHSAQRPLDLWSVIYSDQLDWPVAEHLALCDVVTFWTWRSEELDGLEEKFARLEGIAPAPHKLLGCYMWDYGAEQPMPLDRMKRQCEVGLRWLRGGRIDGMIFLASGLCDLRLETVEWTREWIASVGDDQLP